MTHENINTIASIVVLATFAIVVLIVAIAETAESGLRFLLCLMFLSLFGLARHIYNLGRTSGRGHRRL